MKFDNVKFEAAYGTSAQLPPSSLPEIVFSGRSNVGKSSLINKLFNRRNLARISSVPGKTITINFFRGDSAYFVDLPGYGYAKRRKEEFERWSDLMEGYFQGERKINLVVQLIDFRHTPSDDDYMMLDFMRRKNIPFVIVMTKCDKLNKSETEKRRNELKDELSDFEDTVKIEFSSVTGLGTEDIKQQIINSVEVN